MQELISSITDLVEIDLFGGKAFWLSWLHREGFTVPHAVFLRAFTHETATCELELLFENSIFETKIGSLLNESNLYEVAVRSSGTLEDAKKRSLAGHFETYLGSFSIVELKEKIIKVALSSTQQIFGNVGVIVQQLILPSFSGVLFSSNPVSGAKNEVIISAIQGFGDRLVSGVKSGVDIIASLSSDEVVFSSHNLDIKAEHLEELYGIAKDIEGKLGFPVDIEWCIDQKTDELFVLQCRPLTGYQLEHLGTIPIALKNVERIPALVLDNDKVKLRLLAEESRIKISQASLVVLTCPNSEMLIDLSQVGLDENCKGYSVVLLHPNNIEGNIVRHFAKKEVDKQKSFFRSCQRYQVRQYTDLIDLESIIQSVASRCLDFSWNFVAIIQEIFEPEYTGIVKRISDGYVVELARGHFVPKGIVSTSQYVLDCELSITSKKEVIQRKSYKISDGQVLEEEINENIVVDNSLVIQIVKVLASILKDQDKAVEFGILKQRDSTLIPYLIDLVEDKSKLNLSSNLVLEGVISPGLAIGRLIVVSSEDISKGSLHLHYHNEVKANHLVDEAVIFLCQSPDIALLGLLEMYNNSKIGFIFKEGSTLSHFAIILRERGIPAIVTNAEVSLVGDSTVQLNASDLGLVPLERVKTLTA
jgi:rifampicin phosphotransferase